jgi:hypothetical protein
MATKNPVKKLKEVSKGSGQPFGHNKPTQRNKETMGDKPNRSPGESNANRLRPSVLEDYNKSQNTDTDRISKAMSQRLDGKDEDKLSSSEKFGRKQTRTAGIRAGARSLVRPGYQGLAYTAGNLLGEHVIAPRHIKNLEKYLAENGVKLTKEAKQRIKDEEDFQEMKKAMKETQPEKKKSQTQSERFRARSEEFTSNRKDGYAKGGMTKKRK